MTDPDPRFSTQTKARKAALDVLFQADLRREEIWDLFAELKGSADPPFRPLTVTLVEGVAERLPQLDARIRGASDGQWSLDRMPRVDRCLARLGIFEMDYTDTPSNVVISEVVELASWLSTDDSPAFLNALLARAANDPSPN